MHEDAAIAGIHTEGGWVAFARHITEARKHKIPRTVAIPAASPMVLNVTIFSTDSITSVKLVIRRSWLSMRDWEESLPNFPKCNWA